MEGGEKRINEPNKNKGEGEGPRKGREIRKPPNEGIDDNAPSEEEVRAAILELIKRLRRHEDVIRSGKMFSEIKAELGRLRNEVAKYGIDGFERVFDEMEKYVMRVEEKFKRYHAKEIQGLVEEIERGQIKPKGRSIRSRYITLSFSTPSYQATYQILLKKIGSITVKAPKVLPYDVITPLQWGLLLSDATVRIYYPAMETVSMFQIMLFMLAFPGRIRIDATKLDVNKDGVKIVWRVESKDWDPPSLPECEDEDECQQINEEDAYIALFAGLMGDGSFGTIRRRNHVYPRIRLTTTEKYRWEPILKSIKIKYYEEPYKNGIINITFCCSYAVELMQRIKGIFVGKAPILLRLLDILVNETKIERVRHIMNMEIRKLGEFSVELLGYLFHVNISGSWSIMFMKRMSDVERANAIATEVAQYYGLSNDDIKVYPESHAIIIKPSGILKIIMRDEKVKEETIRVLCKNIKTRREKVK
ncbi:hypothetical protein [Vulcanisaeta distributa]|uniref:Uncharacterized protein n=1 Tax=Vulcanisaeta distributa (strain DSM 14429 / JCM 11212 / NBRC 100878 / IC-017) TaxID=572478 RepID=E1QTV3_VULDI|nr:hypothetical protein [Vulcanisaeta distributa]ADN51020.1 hypothetical protein Vdis_1642 [Vulcanisaeta distributa DSM 14429]